MKGSGYDHFFLNFLNDVAHSSAKKLGEKINPHLNLFVNFFGLRLCESESKASKIVSLKLIPHRVQLRMGRPNRRTGPKGSPPPSARERGHCPPQGPLSYYLGAGAEIVSCGRPTTRILVTVCQRISTFQRRPVHMSCRMDSCTINGDNKQTTGGMMPERLQAVTPTHATRPISKKKAARETFSTEVAPIIVSARGAGKTNQ